MSIGRVRLRELIGLNEPPIALLSCTRDDRGDHTVEHLQFRIANNVVRGLLTRPVAGTRRSSMPTPMAPATISARANCWTDAKAWWNP